METLWQDLRYGIRMLFKKPGFTAVAVLTLALGIGANTAIFSVANSILLKPLPYRDPYRLVLLSNSIPSAAVKTFPLSTPEFADYSSRTEAFGGCGAYQLESFNITGQDEPERISGSSTTAGLFTLLGVDPVLGRAFSTEEDRPGTDSVVLLGHGLWQRRFGSDREIIGQSITLNGRKRTVIGIMPGDFDFPGKVELWVPLALGPESLGKDRLGTQILRVVARLKPGISIERAQAEIDTVSEGFYNRYPEFYKTLSPWKVNIVSLHEQTVGQIRPALMVLLGAVGFMLLIACANVANLLLTRASTRQKEIAIRTMLGAGRWRLIRQLLTESLFLSLLGGALGLLLALWGVDLLLFLAPGDIPRLGEIKVDNLALFFTSTLSLLIGTIFGLAPGLRVDRRDLQTALKEGGRTTAGGGGNRVRSFLVVAEIALSLTLLIGAGLMIRSFVRLIEVRPGFNPENLLTMQISPSVAKYPTSMKESAFYRQVIERIEALPGVISTGGVTALPMSGRDNRAAFTVEGWTAAEATGATSIHYRLITENYFRAMGIPLLQGRQFSRQDDQNGLPVIVINQTAAKRLWPEQDSLGKRISFHGTDGPWFTVVGVVGDVKHTSLEAETDIEAFATYEQNPFPGSRGMTLVVKCASDPLNIAAAAREKVLEVDKDQPVYNIKTMDQYLSNSVSQRRFNMLLLALFASVSLILATVGIYGVINFSVSQRTNEIGIRMALGAQQSDIFKMVLGQGFWLILIGSALGIITSFLLTRSVSSLLFDISPTDPITFSSITLLLAAVSMMACYVPARRATKVDPMVALRYE